jgi:hypothetical protein
MAAQVTWTNGLGFRHLIEDGLAILEDRCLTPERRNYVLTDLSELLLSAKRGSDLVRNQTLFVASADHNAVESFSVFDRFLDEAESDYWQSVLSQSEEALNALKTSQAPKEQAREAAIDLLRKILAGLVKEPKPGIPSQPEEIRFER